LATHLDERGAVVSTELSAIEARLARLEAVDQIRQLAAQYALSLDMRDFDALVNLFVDDVGVPGKQRGRAALKRWYADTMRSVPGSFHGIAGHVIDVETRSTARGVVYSRNDLDLGEHWMLELMIYLDQYERRGDRWYFARRTPLYWVHTDPNVPPLGDAKLRRPGSATARRGAYHDAFPSFAEFCAGRGIGDEPVADPAALDRFIETIRRGSGTPRVDPLGSSTERLVSRGAGSAAREKGE
jgi:hypothetical protein